MKLILSLFLLAVCAINGAAKEHLNWSHKAMTAGRAKLDGNGYINVETIGSPNFSPEFAMPLQLVYDSEAVGLGLFGSIWRCPQLESRLLPLRDGAEWFAPWGEKIRFHSREKLREQSRDKDSVVVFPDETRGQGCFAPYSDWVADGNDSGWKVTGKNKLSGWVFEYRGTRLQSITAPGGRRIAFNYRQDVLESVSQNGIKFIEIKTGSEGVVESISVNGVASAFGYDRLSALILPTKAGGSEQRPARHMLGRIAQAGLEPVVFTYDDMGYLAGISRGRFEEKISVQHESVAERLEWLEKLNKAREARQNTRNMIPAKIAGRILADRNFTYSYPARETVRVNNADNAAVTYNYSAERGILAITDPAGNTTRIYYFRRFDVAYNGKIRQIIDARERVVAAYRYDKKSGDLIRAVDIAGNETYFAYDKDGRLNLVARSEEDGSDRPLAGIGYDADGNPVRIMKLDTDGKNVWETRLTWNRHGDMTSSATPLGRDVFKYNDFGRITQHTDRFGISVTRKYDQFNRMTEVIDANGSVITYSYTDSGAIGEIRRFDAIGKQQLLSSVKFSFDHAGQVIAMTDNHGRTRKFDRDAEGRVVREYFPDDTAVGYSYTPAGQLRQTVDQNGNKISFKWSRLGKIDALTTAVGQTADYQYDKFGLLTGLKNKWKNSTDRTLSYSYDRFDRLEKIDFGDGRTKTIKYNRRGRMIEVTATDGDSVKVESLTWDQFDRVSEKTVTESVKGKEVSRLVYSYAWRADGARTAMEIKFPDGSARRKEWVYEPNGRLAEIRDGDRSVVYRYNGRNQLVEQVIDGMRIAFTYTKLGQLESKILGDNIASLRYEYDRDGMIVARAVNGVRHSYEYDLKGQLIRVVGEGGRAVEEYVYDPAGNILKKTVQGKTTEFTYDAANQLASLSEDGKNTEFVYDAAGRMTSKASGEAGTDAVRRTDYSYGWMNKVMSITENGKVAATFDYQVDGQVASSIHYLSGETGNNAVRRTDYLWDGLALIGRGDMKLTNEPYVTGGNPIIAGDRSESGARVLFNDILGTSQGSTDGKEFSRINRDAFGLVLDNDINTDYDYFTGKPKVEGLGYAFLFRNYNPGLGKWTTSDPLGYPDGWNNFAYVNNRVTSCFDWLGGVTRAVNGRQVAIPGNNWFYHSYTSITLTDSEYNSLDNKYKTGDFTNQWKSDDSGNRTINLSAYNIDGKLTKQVNNVADNNPDVSYFDNPSLNEINSILQNFSNYKNGADYSATTDNCNAFTNTINNQNLPTDMGNPNVTFLFPGIINVIKTQYFE